LLWILLSLTNILRDPPRTFYEHRRRLPAHSIFWYELRAIYMQYVWRMREQAKLKTFRTSQSILLVHSLQWGNPTGALAEFNFTIIHLLGRRATSWRSALIGPHPHQMRCIASPLGQTRPVLMNHRREFKAAECSQSYGGSTDIQLPWRPKPAHPITCSQSRLDPQSSPDKDEPHDLARRSHACRVLGTSLPCQGLNGLMSH
jgi:hypothetical protein